MQARDQRRSVLLLPPPRQFEATPLRLAAVLVPIFLRDGADWLLFTVRRGDLQAHAGQIAFPGGMREGSEDPITCALREAHEEIGVQPEEVTVLGGLPSRDSSSQIRVHVVVGRIGDPSQLRAEPREVERLLAVPWAELRQETRWQQQTPPLPPGAAALRPSPHFQVGADVIWGLTGRITFDLVNALRSEP